MNGQQQHLGGPRDRFGGWTITCSHPECSESTADQAPGGYWRADEDRAVLAARKLGWLHVRTARGDIVWACPLHQARDATAGRWVPALPAEVLA
jgi:hypothetical protein